MKKWIPAAAVFLAVLYFAGPKPGPQNTRPVPVLPDSLEALDRFIRERELSLPVKPDNQARIIWADSLRFRKAPLAVVYIHGFSASYGEGYPLHETFARELGAHLFVARLAGHGLQDDLPFKGIQAEAFFHSAAEAVEIGRRLGDRVLLLGTSMGGALALHETARNDSAIAGVFVYAPLIEFRDENSVILNKPWGGEIARVIAGGDRYIANRKPDEASLRYWYPSYHVDGLVAVKTVQALTATPDVWKHVRIPVFIGYYKKNEQEQDNTVSSDAIVAMAGQLGTPANRISLNNYPGAAAHVITSEHTTKAWPDVLRQSLAFARSILEATAD